MQQQRRNGGYDLRVGKRLLYDGAVWYTLGWPLRDAVASDVHNSQIRKFLSCLASYCPAICLGPQVDISNQATKFGETLNGIDRCFSISSITYSESAGLEKVYQPKSDKRLILHDEERLNIHD